MKAKIIPSAPFKNYEEIEELAMKVSGELKRIQIDICDGKYVGNISWPFTEFPKSDFEKFGKKADFDVYLPFWENINYSADLMCENPHKYIDTLIAYGIDEIIIHFRSLANEEEMETIFEKAINFDLNLILAIDVQTNISDFEKFVNKNIERINGFQVMGIEKIGFQGQEFSKESLEIVKKLKNDYPKKPIYLDGGISDENIVEIKEGGVEVFCVGHFLTKAANFDENLQVLKRLL